jgi:hypothetical protein
MQMTIRIRLYTGICRTFFYVRQNDDGTSAIFTTPDKAIFVRQSAREILKQMEVGGKI